VLYTDLEYECISIRLLSNTSIDTGITPTYQQGDMMLHAWCMVNAEDEDRIGSEEDEWRRNNDSISSTPCYNNMV
jgi:hypothetical protein